MGYKVVIPARWGSTRLPGKVLQAIRGRPMLAYVIEAARESGAETVVVASESEDVLELAVREGGKGCLTSPDHATGTDRIGEVVERLGWGDEEVVVNLQGDEPLMPASLVEQCATLLEHRTDFAMATLGIPLHTREDFENPNIVKVVVNFQGRALYFSRAQIPWPRDDGGAGSGPGGASRVRGALRHIGLYAYRVSAIKRLAQEPPCELEEIERLEQLRALWIGIDIAVEIGRSIPGPSVDTSDDVRRVEEWMAQGARSRGGHDPGASGRV
ncbi:MAG: 3-deoxy-manno-octulosonate cytidylyltransferase [Gammaproteobacteria bacterium]